MQPIRGEREEEFVHDPWEKNQQQVGQNDTVHVVSDAGGIESHRTGRRVACVCGCLKPAGGFCSECTLPVCVDCYGFCADDGCHKPLCPRHSVFTESESGARVRFCQSCYGKVSRKKIARGVFRALFSLFIEFEDHHGQK